MKFFCRRSQRRSCRQGLTCWEPLGVPGCRRVWGGLFHRRHLIAHISLCYIIGTWRPEPASLEYLFLNAKEHRRPSPLNACPESDPRDSRSFCLVPAYSGLLWVKPSQAKGVNSGGGFVKTAFEERPLTGSFTNAGVDGCR